MSVLRVYSLASSDGNGCCLSSSRSMADSQSWRRHMHRPGEKTHIYHDHIDKVAPSDETSYSTSPGADDNKLRPRPGRSLASFASYLGTHHRTVHPSSRPEWPSIDWSNLKSLNDKESVYTPDMELMCTSITQTVLANPSADLPAQYNTFLLHLIEAYRQCKANAQELQMKLVEETECNQSAVDELHRAVSSSPLENAHILQSLEMADVNTFPSTGPGNEISAARLRKYNCKLNTSKSSIHYEDRGQKQKQADQTRTSERHQLMSSARRYHGPSTAAMEVGSKPDYWPPSPGQNGMELIDCDASNAGIEGEGHSVLISASNTFASLEDNLASRLAGWLALHLKCQPEDIFSELSDLVRSTRKELQKSSASSTIGTLRPNMPTASGTVTSLGRNKILPDRSNKLIGANGSVSFQSVRAIGHRRGFSFLPGNDSANPLSSNAFGSQDADYESSFVHPVAWQYTKQSEDGKSDKLTKTKLSSGMAVDSRSQQQLIKSVVSSTAGSDTSRDPQRDGSGKSVLTTIINSSSHSSSLSHRRSLNDLVGIDSLRQGSIRPKNSHLAITTARAANNRTINGRAFHRQLSS